MSETPSRSEDVQEPQRNHERGYLSALKTLQASPKGEAGMFWRMGFARAAVEHGRGLLTQREDRHVPLEVSLPWRLRLALLLRGRARLSIRVSIEGISMRWGIDPSTSRLTCGALSTPLASLLDPPAAPAAAPAAEPAAAPAPAPAAPVAAAEPAAAP